MAKQTPQQEKKTPVEPVMVDIYVSDIAGNISIVKAQKSQKFKPGDRLGTTGSYVATAAQIAAYKAAKVAKDITQAED